LYFPESLPSIFSYLFFSACNLPSAVHKSAGLRS
jgi:hypothetical protein